MKRVKLGRWFVMACAALGAVALGTCGDSKSCVHSNCVSGAWLTIPVASTASALVGTTVTVCRNAECYAASLPDVPSAGDTEATLYFTGATFVLGALSQAADHTIELDIEWIASATPVQDGDHYVVTLTGASGVATTLLDKVATYSLLAPSADECATDPVCQIAELGP